MAKADVTVPLGIPEVEVVKTETNQRGELLITIKSTKKGTNCHWCGQWITKPHGSDDWVQVRHLSVFGRPTYLRYRPRRYRCESCAGNPTRTQELDWQEKGSPNTLAYEEYVLLQLVHSTIEDVSIKEKMSYDSVLGVMERRIAAKTEWSRYTVIGRLGLAVIESVEEAILNSMLMAETVVGRDGNTRHQLPAERVVEIVRRYRRPGGKARLYKEK